MEKMTKPETELTEKDLEDALALLDWSECSEQITIVRDGEYLVEAKEQINPLSLLNENRSKIKR